MKINQSGRSMIEMLGVLAIIGVLSVGGIAGYSKAMNKYRTNKITDQVSMIVANIRTLYAMQAHYEGLDNSSAIGMGVIPDEMHEPNSTTLLNPYQGKVHIYSGRSKAGSDLRETAGAFNITYTNLPREACVTLASGDWGSNTSAGLIAIKAQGSFPEDEDPADDGDNMLIGCKGSATAAATGTIACPTQDTTGTQVPMQVSRASVACGCDSNTCSITWKYY